MISIEKLAFTTEARAICGLVLLISTQLAAQSSGGDFVIPRETIDNGGGRSSDNSFIVTGTIGQHEASGESASGGEFIVTGGFWANGPVEASGDEEIFFRDGFESFTLDPTFDDAQ